MKYCDEYVTSVCLFVCLFARISQKPSARRTEHHQFLSTLPTVVARYSSDGVKFCNRLCTSGFVYNVIFHIMAYGVSVIPKRR